MDMNNMEEDQVVHDTTQVQHGTLSTIMGLHGILRNIQQMLAPLKHYIKASEAGIVQTPLMAQALLVAQTAYANVPTGNAKEPKFIMLEKFDATRSKFSSFV
jgi:hypothetical protein